MERNNNMGDTKQNQPKHAFYFFGNEQSIIDALHLFMIRRPHELLNNNKRPQGRAISYPKNVITYCEEPSVDTTTLGGSSSYS